MIFVVGGMLGVIAFVWAWYSHNYGKSGFDDWDKDPKPWPGDWHRKEEQ